MKDRVSNYPGRVKMTPVTGKTNIYDMELADDPIEAGTPLNKATFLTDATASKLGFASTDDPTVDDAFNAVPRLSQIQQTLPVAEGVTVQAGDVVDVVDGQVTRPIVQENVLSQLGTHSTSSNANPALAMLDNEHVLIAYNSGTSPYLNIAVCDLTTEQPSITAQTTISIPANISYLRAVALSSTIVALSWKHASLNYPQVCAIQINSTTITAGTPFTAAGPTGIVHMHAFSETQFLIVSSSSDVGSTYYIPFTVNADLSCTQGTYKTMSGGFNPSYLARSENFGEGVAVVAFPTNDKPKVSLVKLTGSGSTAAVTVSTVSGNYNAQSCAVIKTGDNTFIWGVIHYDSGTLGGQTRWAVVTIDESALTIGTLYNTTTLACGYQTATYMDDDNIIHVYGIQSNGQIVESTVIFSETGFTAGSTTTVDDTAFEGYGDSYSVMNGTKPIFVSGIGGKLQMFRFFNQSTATQALALTSGTEGQNVDIAYDGVFDFDGLSAGQSVYDGNDALIAYCPVNGKVNVIGYWKRQEKQYVTGTYTGTGTYGASSPNQLNVGFLPSLVIVQGGNTNMIFIQNNQKAYSTDQPGNSNYLNTVTWNNDGISWYSTGNANVQSNISGTIYNYIAWRGSNDNL